MVSRVLYRPFDTEDFDAIALILQQLWHNNSDNDEYNRLEARATSPTAFRRRRFHRLP